VESCPRARKGFSRKRNRDGHARTHHQASPSGDIAVESVRGPEPLGLASPVVSRVGEGADFGEVEIPDDISRLRVKLTELERQREELAMRQVLVEGDIQAVKRAMQLVSV
jgi:hypothetical protein